MVAEADRYRRWAWRELQVSADKFHQAELLFNWRTEVVKDKHGLGAEDDLTVEAVIDRKNDEQWQTSVADCRYHMQRMTAYGGLHAAAVAELRLLYGQ
jgi:hypothetical protein